MTNQQERLEINRMQSKEWLSELIAELANSPRGQEDAEFRVTVISAATQVDIAESLRKIAELLWLKHELSN